MGFSIKRILGLFILLSFSFHLNAENGRLLGAITVDEAPLFLVGQGHTLELKELDGTTVDSIANCVVVDIADASRWITIESTEDSTILNIRNALEIVESVPLEDPCPLIRLMQNCSRVSLTRGSLVLIPELTPVLWNQDSGIRRPIAALFREEGGALILQDLSYMKIVEDMVFVQSGDMIEALRLSTLKTLATAQSEDNLLDAIGSDGRALLRLTGGERLLWTEKQKQFKRLDRVEDDRDALVFRWEPVAGRVMNVRLALDDMGLFDALSAWKSGQLEADLQVRAGDRSLLEKRLVFSVKDVGNFVFRVVRRDHAVLIQFREKTEILHFKNEKPMVTSVDDQWNPIVYKGRVYVLEGGAIRELTHR